MLRTKRLAYAVASAANVAQTVYTCPAGIRAIARDIRVFNGSAGSADRVLVYIHPSGVTDTYWLLSDTVAFNGRLGLVCDVVLEPGDAIGLYASAAAVGVYISGAELALA